jgi:hypothetical protein
VAHDLAQVVAVLHMGAAPVQAVAEILAVGDNRLEMGQVEEARAEVGPDVRQCAVEGFRADLRSRWMLSSQPQRAVLGFGCVVPFGWVGMSVEAAHRRVSRRVMCPSLEAGTQSAGTAVAVGHSHRDLVEAVHWVQGYATVGRVKRPDMGDAVVLVVNVAWKMAAAAMGIQHLGVVRLG